MISLPLPFGGVLDLLNFVSIQAHLECFSHRITMEVWNHVRWKTAKIHRNEHTPEYTPTSFSKWRGDSYAHLFQISTLIRELTPHSTLQLAMRMLRKIHAKNSVDRNFSTDYGVYCCINTDLFRINRDCVQAQHCSKWNHTTQVPSFHKGEECSEGGDSSTLLGQTILCSGIVFALETSGHGFKSQSQNWVSISISYVY